MDWLRDEWTDSGLASGWISVNTFNYGFTFSSLCQPSVINGTAYLIEQDFDLDNALWYDPLALVLFFVGFSFLAVLELRYLRKNRWNIN